MTTTATITLAQIQALRTEAAAAGDTQMVAICDRAARALCSSRLRSSDADVCKCVAAISDAEAQDDRRIER